jgi:hypothetical protein
LYKGSESARNNLTKDPIFLILKGYIGRCYCSSTQDSMAEHEDGTLASQSLRDENHFQNKLDLTEVDKNSHPSELNVSWESIFELGILAKTSDGMPCGNVICSYKDNIVVIDFGRSRLLNEYLIPISRVKGYDGKYIYLTVPNETNLQLYVY